MGLTDREKNVLDSVISREQQRVSNLQERKRQLDAEVRRKQSEIDRLATALQERIKALLAVKQDTETAIDTVVLNGTTGTDTAVLMPPSPSRIGPSEAVAAYELQTGNREYSAADVKAYCVSAGHEVSKHFYLNLREYLDRQVKLGKMTRVNGKYKRTKLAQRH
jgi:exonuclease VII large subunit